MKTGMALKIKQGCGWRVAGKASRFGHMIVSGKEIKLEGEEERGVWVCSPDLGKLRLVRGPPPPMPPVSGHKGLFSVLFWLF